MEKFPWVKLESGVEMPQIGYGAFGIRDNEECRRCIGEAIESGYRLFDTASAYFNEAAVGAAVQDAISLGTIRREDIFMTTKVWLQDYGRGETKASVVNSLQNLQMDYLDLVLLHQPFGRWKEAWRALEELYEEGMVRAIGVSNFTEGKITELLHIANRKPDVDQIEAHPFYTQKELTDKLRKTHIQTEAWGPLNEGQRGIFSNTVLTEIGRVYGKTPAQVALHWNLQRGNVVIPGTRKIEHMKENLDIFDFQLSSDEMERIEKLDYGYSEIMDFENPATEHLLLKYRIHD